MNNKNLKNNGFVPKLATVKFPVELFKIIMSWDCIIKSPYGHSYYSAPVDWNHKEHNSYRISDHWNFRAKGTMHCCTAEDVVNDTHYTLAQFNSKTGLWTPILSLPKPNIQLSYTKEFQLAQLNESYNISLSKITEKELGIRLRKKVISDIELNTLNKYYKILQSYENRR